MSSSTAVQSQGPRHHLFDPKDSQSIREGLKLLRQDSLRLPAVEKQGWGAYIQDLYEQGNKTVLSNLATIFSFTGEKLNEYAKTGTISLRSRQVRQIAADQFKQVGTGQLTNTPERPMRLDELKTGDILFSLHQPNLLHNFIRSAQKMALGIDGIGENVVHTAIYAGKLKNAKGQRVHTVIEMQGDHVHIRELNHSAPFMVGRFNDGLADELGIRKHMPEAYESVQEVLAGNAKLLAKHTETQPYAYVNYLLMPFAQISEKSSAQDIDHPQICSQFAQNAINQTLDLLGLCDAYQKLEGVEYTPPSGLVSPAEQVKLVMNSPFMHLHGQYMGKTDALEELAIAIVGREAVSLS